MFPGVHRGHAQQNIEFKGGAGAGTTARLCVLAAHQRGERIVSVYYTHSFCNSSNYILCLLKVVHDAEMWRH